MFLYFFVFLFTKLCKAETVDWCNPSNLGTEVEELKKTIDALQSITKSKSCQQMLGRLRKSKSLDLSNREISDIRILMESDLEVLLLRSTFVTDISVLQHQKKLRILDISKTRIDASQIPYIPPDNIEILYLGNNKLQGVDFRKLCAAPKLTFVSLKDSHITNVESFQRCRHLSFLSLEGNEISDISMIRGLKNIKSIDLYGNPLQDCPVKKNSTLYHRCMEAKEQQWEKPLEK